MILNVILATYYATAIFYFTKNIFIYLSILSSVTISKKTFFVLMIFITNLVFSLLATIFIQKELII